MHKLKPEYKIAITVIVAMAALLWGINFLKGKNLFNTGDVYYGEYTRLNGLTEASPVYYNGYKIGTVQQIDFFPQKTEKFLVTIALDKSMTVTDQTIATISSLDLMGSKAVKFMDVEKGNPVLPGDTLKTRVTGGLQDQISTEFKPVKDKVESLLVKLDSTLSGFSGVFSEQNNQSLEKGMQSFRVMMHNLEQSSAALNSTLGKDGAIQHSLARIDSLTYALNEQRQSITTTLENMSRFSGQLKAMNLDTMAARIDSGVTAVNTLLQKTNQGEGSLGLLLSDNGLYYNLLDASANLDRLLADVRHNPGRYINLSAIDMGRDIYLQVDDEKAREKEIVFKVKIRESEKPLDLKNKMVKDEYRIFEDTNGEKYIYSIGQSSSYAEISDLRDQITDIYPHARIIAFENEEPVKIRRALRKIGEKQ